MKVVFLDAASHELRDAAYYLENKQAALGERFLEQVKRAELLIERFRMADIRSDRTCVDSR